MSILGIRNQLRDSRSALQYAPDKGDDVLGAAAFVEDALHDWEHKYPADPWLAKSVFDLTSLYAQRPTPHGHDDATRAFNGFLHVTRIPPYGAQARATLRRKLDYRDLK